MSKYSTHEIQTKGNYSVNTYEIVMVHVLYIFYKSNLTFSIKAIFHYMKFYLNTLKTSADLFSAQEKTLQTRTMAISPTITKYNLVWSSLPDIDNSVA